MLMTRSIRVKDGSGLLRFLSQPTVNVSDFTSDTFRVHVTSWTHLMEEYTDYTSAAQVFIFCRVSHGTRRAAEMVSQSKSSADVILMCADVRSHHKGPLRSIWLQLTDDD